jgi:hypothetical protein
VTLLPHPRFRGFEQVEEAADLLADLCSVTHCLVAVDVVAVASADSDPVDVARFDEVGEDPLGGSFGDSDRFRDVTEADFWVSSETEEHLAVVGEERPTLLVGVCS